MLLLFPGAISHPGLLQMRKETKPDYWSERKREIIQNAPKQARHNQGVKLILKAT